MGRGVRWGFEVLEAGLDLNGETEFEPVLSSLFPNFKC